MPRGGHRAVVFGRFFLAMIMALALALGPLAMPGEQAMAATPASHHAMDAAHCDEQQRPDRPDEPDSNCCVAGCIAVAALAAPALEPVALQSLRTRAAPDRFQFGHLDEIATPPPRCA